MATAVVRRFRHETGAFTYETGQIPSNTYFEVLIEGEQRLRRVMVGHIVRRYFGWRYITGGRCQALVDCQPAMVTVFRDAYASRPGNDVYRIPSAELYVWLAAAALRLGITNPPGAKWLMACQRS